MNLEERLKALEKKVEELSQKHRNASGDYAPLSVHQQDIDGILIFRGLLAAKPTNGDTEIQAYYAEDTKTLYIWNTVNNAWELEIFT